MQLCIGEYVLQEALSEKTAAALGTKLESLYMTKIAANCLGILQYLYMLRMVEGTLIRSYEFTTLVMEFKYMDETFSSKQQAMMLLCYLPPSFKHFQETLVYRRERYIDEVKSSLLSREKMQHDSGHNDAASGLIVRGNSKEIDLSSRSLAQESLDLNLDFMKADVDIAKRKKKGIQKSFPRLKDKNERDSTDQASVVESAGNFLSISTNTIGDAWILDSGCSYHICQIQDWFTTYQPIDGGGLLNNMSSKGIGIGTVQIKIQGAMVRTFV